LTAFERSRFHKRAKTSSVAIKYRTIFVIEILFLSMISTQCFVKALQESEMVLKCTAGQIFTKFQIWPIKWSMSTLWRDNWLPLHKNILPIQYQHCARWLCIAQLKCSGNKIQRKIKSWYWVKSWFQKFCKISPVTWCHFQYNFKVVYNIILSTELNIPI